MRRFFALVGLLVGLIASAAVFMIWVAPHDAMLAYVDYDDLTDSAEHVYLWDARTRQRTPVSNRADIWTEPVWSRDGHLAWITPIDDHIGTLSVWNGHKISIISRQAYVTPSWSPDGRLAWSDYDETKPNPDPVMKIWDGQSIQVIGLGTSSYWSPDGRLAWIGGADASYGVSVWDGHSITSWMRQFNLSSLVWSDDGRLAWIANGPGSTYIVSIWDGKTTMTIGPEPHWAIEPTWSHDGRLAWLQSQPGEGGSIENVLVWDGVNVALAGPFGCGTPLTWFDDGRLAWGAGDCDTHNLGTYIWDGSSLNTVDIRDNDPYPSGPVWRPTWSDGPHFPWTAK